MLKHPLLPVLLCYAAGVVGAAFRPFPVAVGFAVAGGLAAATLALPRARPWLLALLLFTAGAVNLNWRMASLAPDDLRGLAGDAPRLVSLRGRLVETPGVRLYERDGQETARTPALVDVATLNAGNGWVPASGRVAVGTPGTLGPEFFAGRGVEVYGVLHEPRPPRAPGLFDARRYFRWQGIFYQLDTQGAADWRIAAGVAQPARPPLADRFSAWAQRTLARGLPAEDEPLRLLWAMTLGWRTALTDEVSTPFMRSGTMHIFAISGLHIALIAGILVAVLRVLQVPRAATGLVVIPLIWFYTAATGWQASAVRSTVMMTILIGGWALERPGSLLNSLAASALVILALDPRQTFQASFQLSFLVVLSLALVVPALERLRDQCLHPDPLLPPELLPRWRRWLDTPLRWLLASVATSFAAWLGSLPLVAIYFNLLTPVSLLANLVVVPLSSLALMCNLGALACGDWLPWLTERFNHAAWFWMTGMIRFSEWTTVLPGAWFFVPTPGLPLVLAWYAMLVAACGGWFLGRRVRWALAATGGALALLAGTQQFLARNEARLTLIPLNGGVALWLDLPGRAEDLLIDCGDPEGAGRVVLPFLRTQGVNGLPNLALSHGSAPHAGGAALVASNHPPARVWTGPRHFRSPSYRDFTSYLEHRPGGWSKVARGDRLAGWDVLHPAGDDAFGQAQDNALVLRRDFGGVRVLLLSDLGAAGQAALLEREAGLQADLVVVGLPRGGEPLEDPLLRAIRPRLVVVTDDERPFSARAGAALRQRLARSGAEVVFTSERGPVTLTLRPRGWRLADLRGGEREWAARASRGDRPHLPLASARPFASNAGMPDWLAIVILGIIEGITEFLPISSTGHLLLAEHWLPPQSELFNIVIQSGAVLAVIPLFHKRFHQFLFGWRDRATQDYAAKILAAFVITGVGGLVLKKAGLKLPEKAWPIAVALVLGGVAFLIAEARLRGRQLAETVSWAMAMAVGVAQLVAAVFPGTSRSGASIIFLLLLGLARPLATEFAFLVGIPTMLAAGAYEIYKALKHPVAGTPPENWSMVALGFGVSAVISFLAVKWLLGYVQSHTFKGFGWYRIVAGVAILLLLLA